MTPGRGGRRGGGDGDENKKQRRYFGGGTGATLLSFPVTPRQIADAVEARGECAVSFLDGNADFGWRWWSEVNCSMLRPSLRETAAFWDNSPQT